MSFSDDEELLTERELSQHLKRSQRQLQRDRAEGRGIPFILVEKQVRYRRGDVRAYKAQHLVGAHTEQEAKHSAATATAAAKPRSCGRACRVRSAEGGGQ